MLQLHNRARKNEGFAIFLTIMIVAVISVFSCIVFFQSRQTRYQSEVKCDAAQAAFLAKGAENHLLLKFKLLPSDLYEAVNYAVGRNPAFDFTTPISILNGDTFTTFGGAVANFGPMFFTGTNTGDVQLDGGSPPHVRFNRSAETNLYTNTAVGFTDSVNDPNQARMEYMLNHYLLDVETDFPAPGNLAIVTVSSTAHNDVAQMGVSLSANNFSNRPRMNWQDPFCGSYYISGLKLLGSGGTTSNAVGQKYSQDALLITAEATIIRDQQVSLVTQLPGGGLKPFVLQKHTNAKFSEGAGGGWVQLQETQEQSTDASFQNRTVSGYSVQNNGPGTIAGTSGRRTEIVTDVYFVTRQ